MTRINCCDNLSISVTDFENSALGKTSAETSNRGGMTPAPSDLQQFFRFSDHVIYGEAKHFKQLLSRR